MVVELFPQARLRNGNVGEVQIQLWHGSPGLHQMLTPLANSIPFAFKVIDCQDRSKLASVRGTACGIRPSQHAGDRSVNLEIAENTKNRIRQRCQQIRAADRQVEQLADTQYPEAAVLQKVPGVGPLTALTFVLTIGDEKRFARSREVGCYLGLRPRQQQSGERDPQLGITKAGNGYLRMLLVECAQHVLGVFGPDTALRRWGLRLAERGGKKAKRRAIVAVARKLAVLLHRLWVTKKPYEPFYGVPAPTTTR
jgi:Transposase IS116/IS110/IS902 family